MALQIGAALRDGFFKVASRTGAILVAAFLVTNVVFEVSSNGLLKTLYAREGFGEMSGSLEPALNAPLAVNGVLVALSIFSLIYLSIVAIRTFVAGNRDSFRGEHLTEGVAFAIANILVGSVVQSIIVMVGFAFFVIPGVFLTVALVFMTVFIAVENENFVTAMRRSWRLTEGSRWGLFSLGVLVFAVTMAVAAVVVFGSMVGGAVGVDPIVASVLVTALVMPLSLYNTGVLASAFNQLRGDELDEPADGTAASGPSSSVA